MSSTLFFALFAFLIGFSATTLVGNNNQKLWRQMNSVKWVSLMENEVGDDLQDLVDRFIPGQRRLKAFSWNDCGPKDPIDLTYLSITPDPIKLPGNTNLSFTVDVKQTLTQIAAAVTVEKKIVGHYERIPCIGYYGSCTYPDVCAIIDKEPCPAPFIANGIPCKCPINQGNYHLPSSQFYISDGKIPPVLTNGDYKASVVFKSGNQQIGCYNLTVTLA